MSKTTIPTAGLADAAVTTAKITDANITTAKIADDAVTAAKATGFGKVAQVVQAICSGGDSSTNSSTLQSTNVAVTITPSASDSKVLVSMNFGGSSGADQNKTLGLRMFRGSTALGNNTQIGNYNATSAGQRSHNMSIQFLDSPSTTSATTYTLKFHCAQGDSTVSITASGDTQAYAQAMEILA